MEAFLLAIMSTAREGTFYSLQRDYDLNPGGIAHALATMQKNGLVTRLAKSGPRQAFEITKRGQQKLHQQWRAIVNRGWTDRDSALRVAWVTIVMDLGNAAALLRTLAANAQTASDIRPSSPRADDLYFSLKRALFRHEQLALAAAVKEIASLVERNVEQ